jgi:hypothetical protein
MKIVGEECVGRKIRLLRDLIFSRNAHKLNELIQTGTVHRVEKYLPNWDSYCIEVNGQIFLMDREDFIITRED